MNRRTLLGIAMAALATSPALTRSAWNYEVVKTEAEWRAQLTAAESEVLRRNGT
jgi:hypothetical protein